jgi:hypothetical protein
MGLANGWRHSWLMFLVSSLASGCTHMVAGTDSVPRSERAILDATGACVHLIDGERPRSCLTTRFELPPGKHHVALTVGEQMLPRHALRLSFDARSGRTYVLDIVEGWRLVPHTVLVNIVDKEEYDARTEFSTWGGR